MHWSADLSSHLSFEQNIPKTNTYKALLRQNSLPEPSANVAKCQQKSPHSPASFPILDDYKFRYFSQDDMLSCQNSKPTWVKSGSRGILGFEVKAVVTKARLCNVAASVVRTKEAYSRLSYATQALRNGYILETNWQIKVCLKMVLILVQLTALFCVFLSLSIPVSKKMASVGPVCLLWNVLDEMHLY